MKPVPFPTPEEIAKIKLFFIIGRPRSGTTLLRTLLDAHPNVIVPTECPFILHLSKRYKNIKKLNPKIVNQFIIDIQKVWLFNSTKIDIENLKNNLLFYCGEINYLTLCKIVILNFPEIFPKERIIIIGDKNPAYSLRYKKFFKLFGAQCRYIYLMRDLRDQFLSLKNISLEFPYISTVAKRWKLVHHLIYKSKDKYPNNFHVLRYEDLVSNPEKEFSTVCEFLNIPINKEVLNFHEHKNDFEKLFTQKTIENIHKSLLNPIKPDKIGKWKTSLSRNEKDIALLIAGKQLANAGYETSEILNKTTAKIKAIPGLVIFYTVSFIIELSYLLPTKLYLRVSKGAVLGYFWHKYIIRK